MTKQIDLGNNETALRGVTELHGRFTAHTGVSSKTFNTHSGAANWLAKMDIEADGSFKS